MSNSAAEKTSGINWSKVLDLPGSRTDAGSPDLPAILRFLEEELTAWISKNDIPVSEIEEALEKLYVKYPNGGFDMQGICNRALQEITSIPEGTESKVLKRIGNYIRSESNKFRSGGDGKWCVTPGKGVKVQKVNMAFADAYWAKQEAKAAKKEEDY